MHGELSVTSAEDVWTSSCAGGTALSHLYRAGIRHELRDAASRIVALSRKTPEGRRTIPAERELVDA